MVVVVKAREVCTVVADQPSGPHLGINARLLISNLDGHRLA